MHKILFVAFLTLLTSCGSMPSKTDASSSVPASLDLAMTDMDGNALDLASDLSSGRPVVLVFWQTWCGSCRAEAPALAKVAERLKERARFVGVVPGPDELVDDGEVRTTAEDWGLPYAQVRDRDNALTSGLGVEGTPTILVIGPGREIRYRGHRLPSDWDSLLR